MKQEGQKRNPIAKALRDPKFRPKVIPNKRKVPYVRKDRDLSDCSDCNDESNFLCRPSYLKPTRI